MPGCGPHPKYASAPIADITHHGAIAAIVELPSVQRACYADRIQVFNRIRVGFVGIIP